LALSKNNRWLFVVNAGSNQISVFAVTPAGLKRVDLVDSGGTSPISLDIYGHLLYVLNAGGAGNITGFRIGANGHLTALSGSTQPLSNGGQGAAPGPAQVAFSPNGKTLLVTEKASNLLLAYPVEDGLAQAPVAHPSVGMTPFGFEFSRRGYLIVSEAFGGQPNLSAVSSYSVHGTTIAPVSPSVGTTQTAACWIAISKNDRYAYAANTGSGSISSYRIGKDGVLILLNPVAGLIGQGGAAIDLAFSSTGRYLYSLGGGINTITAFGWNRDGSLTNLGSVSVPAGSVGLVAR
jgi:6-phosphogluconolactonase (cycloisomerase 2 family)